MKLPWPRWNDPLSILTLEKNFPVTSGLPRNQNCSRGVKADRLWLLYALYRVISWSLSIQLIFLRWPAFVWIFRCFPVFGCIFLAWQWWRSCSQGLLQKSEVLNLRSILWPQKSHLWQSSLLSPLTEHPGAIILPMQLRFFRCLFRGYIYPSESTHRTVEMPFLGQDCDANRFSELMETGMVCSFHLSKI